MTFTTLEILTEYSVWVLDRLAVGSDNHVGCECFRFTPGGTTFKYQSGFYTGSFHSVRRVSFLVRALGMYDPLRLRIADRVPAVS